MTKSKKSQKTTKKCCDTKKVPKNKLEGLMYGLIPHIGCIGFIIGSVLGVTVLMQFFKPLLMNRYFFHYLILISIGFATLSSVLYLRKHKLLHSKGIKSEWKYLSGMFGSTIGINLVLFFLVFPMMANLSFASEDFSTEGLSGLTISVDIPCPGHAPLITNELKAVDGVKDVTYSFPNDFEILYDSSVTSKAGMLGIEVFSEYPATVLSEEEATAATFTASSVTSTPTAGACGSPTCGGGSSCTGAGSCGSTCGAKTSPTATPTCGG